MSNGNEIVGTDLAARLARLPRDIEPAIDLWPGIARAIGDEHGNVESLARRLEWDIEPDVDLWPAIEARLHERAPVHARRFESWLSAAASLATVAIIAGLASFKFMTGEQTSGLDASRFGEPAGDELWWLSDTTGTAVPPAGTLLGAAFAAIRADLTAVQNERVAIERSLAQDAENVALHGLWSQVYQTELELAGKAEQLIESYQGV